MNQRENDYNRIVIIGNGLDLALGLRTSYSDFLLDYFKTCLNKAKQAPYSDLNFKIDQTAQIRFKKPIEDIVSLVEWNDLVKRNHQWNLQYKGILDDIMQFHKIDNWVDIESLYFDSLIPKIDLIKKTPAKSRNFKSIEEFNNSFRELTNNLDRYIKKVGEISSSSRIFAEFFWFIEKCSVKQTNQRTCLNHGVNYDLLEGPNNLLFLNFNYTNSINQIISISQLKPKTQVLNIHGRAGNHINPIIFGYGDDTHPNYKDLEQERSDVPLEFVKSFYYNRTNDYHEMLGFMDMGKYEIYIIGHSCGLSDRTLLKSIFENKNCISIKIFHRGSIDEHVKKNMAISRHFEDKQLLRKRVLPFDEQAVIPQKIHS